MIRKRLWAPWREAYFAVTRNPPLKGCLFCRLKRSKPDKENQILTKGPLGFSLLNRYPYNNGHLMVVPNRHVARLDQLSPEEWVELLRLGTDAVARLEKVMHPHGYNLGINIGRAAGAGIPGHLHLHIVPRWIGDTNFMPTIANTKVISQSLASSYRLLNAVRPRRRVHARARLR